jgi:dipeptidyl aminopeptidase/acylaminoacyl peptidase
MVVEVDPSGAFTGTPRSATKDLDRSADAVVWGADASGKPWIYFLAEENGRVEPFTVYPDGSGAGRLFKSNDVEGTFGSLTTSRDGSQLTYTIAKMNHPPEVYAGDRKPISKAADAVLAEFDLPRPESVSVPGAGGQPMQMWILKPPGFDPAKKWPLAFLVHGGPQSAWMDGWSNRWNPEVWAAQGYVVALPNPRGSTGFGQKYTDEISGDWGGKCFDDLMGGLAYMESQPFIDKDRMFAAGASFGGYMMNWFQGKTNKFKTLVTHCGVYNFDSMYATTEEIWFDEWEHGGPPWGNTRESYEKHSPHRLAANFQTPMLIIHNDLDFRVPVSEGLQLFTTLQRKGVPSKFINFPDEGHWVLKPANSAFWHREVFAWVKRYCPPGGK